MIRNIDLFEYSLSKPEQLVDNFYIKSGSIIISDSPSKPNELMKKNKELLENISAFKIAENASNTRMMNHSISNIHILMKTNGINFSEFASFLSVMDVSYSTYRDLTDAEQLIFLKIAVRKYIRMRHDLYMNHGYSATTIQVGKDAKSHKSSGPLGNGKMASILNKFGYSRLSSLTVKDLNKLDNVYIFTDKTGKKLFKDLLKEYKIEFRWKEVHENKMPDLMFKRKNNFYIVEHKHMKEGGGGQDKQLNEVISFIAHSEKILSPKIHYLTFIDGGYFNLFIGYSSKVETKTRTQIAKIRRTLQDNPLNYFVNTAGFEELLRRLK